MYEECVVASVRGNIVLLYIRILPLYLRHIVLDHRKRSLSVRALVPNDYYKILWPRDEDTIVKEDGATPYTGHNTPSKLNSPLQGRGMECQDRHPTRSITRPERGQPQVPCAPQESGLE